MTDSNNDDMTIEEMVSFAVGQAEEEAAEFEGNVPKYAERMIVNKASEIGHTISRHELIEANEGQDDEPLEALQVSLEEDVVEVLLAIGMLAYEYDLDIADAYQDRVEFMEAFESLQADLNETETASERQDVFDDYADDLDMAEEARDDRPDREQYTQ